MINVVVCVFTCEGAIKHSIIEYDLVPHGMFSVLQLYYIYKRKKVEDILAHSKEIATV